MPGSGMISPYHNRVAIDVKEILGKDVKFFSPDGDKWQKARDSSEVEFEIVPIDPAESEPAMRMRREDSRVHRVSVFPLCDQSSSCIGTFWVSWHETWRKEDAKNFVLLNAGWTLFEGLPGSEDKSQVLRADWDQLNYRGSKRAGHPHWHFDHELFIRAEASKVEVAPGLVKVPADEAFTMAEGVSIGYVHLAMGAWNKGTDHPECWQRTYEDDCKQLRDWCVKTLKYLKEQVGGE